jgi:hypothetical protein
MIRAQVTIIGIAASMGKFGAYTPSEIATLIGK